MSFSVDELVSSLSTSHIGQEAMDLAALQAQLAQTLFAQPMVSTSSRDHSIDSSHQPCNTPTGRTPSSSFSWGQVMDVQQRMNSRRTTDEMIDDAEDERMVEDLLIPSSPSGGYSSSPFAIQQQRNSAVPRSQSKGPNRFTSTTSSAPMSPGTETSSSFTSTDPFYLAQLQAMQSHNTSPQSVFSQLGRPAQQSPFIQQQQRRESLSFSPSSISLDTHNMFAATSVAFEC